MIYENKTIIYGSTAVKHWFNDFGEPNDIDVITTEDRKSTKEIQYYWVDAFDYIFKNQKDLEYVEPDLLYTIKVSHASWDINWGKTMMDIEFLRKKGCELDKKFYDLLYKEWEILHGKKKVKMNVPNEEFFTNTIKRKYSHDGLHEIFKFYDRPLNEKIRKDLSTPLCSEDLWDGLSKDEKIKSALEEIFVLTTERYIKVDRPLPTKLARVKMLKQMIVSTTSGFFNLFLIENFEELRTSKEKYFKTKLKEIE